MSRTENVAKNMLWKMVGLGCTAVLNFANRYVFMHWLGPEYLGVSGLFGSVFGVLALADLGLNSAFAFCFYQAIANEDQQHCAFLTHYLKKKLNLISAVMLFAGLLITPFIPALVTGNEMISDKALRLYYVLFLFDLIIPYTFMARLCYITARQQEYVVEPIMVLSGIIKVVVGMVCVCTTRNYVVFLLSGIIIHFAQYLFLNRYAVRRFPELSLAPEGALKETEKKTIVRNVKAIVVAKIATVSIYQTDNILTSIGIGIVTTGFVSNYVSIKNMITSLISHFTGCLTPSMGNVIVTESEEKQLNIFYQYLALNTFLVCGCFVGLTTLASPFIALLFGQEAVLSQEIVFFFHLPMVFAFSFYALEVLPTAHGRRNIGISMVWVETIANLIISVVAMKQWGLIGIYIGTLVAQLLVYFIKPFIIMSKLYNDKPWKFFCITGRGIVVALIIWLIIKTISRFLFRSIETWGEWMLLAVLTAGIYFVGYSILHWRNPEYKNVLHKMVNYTTNIFVRIKSKS